MTELEKYLIDCDILADKNYIGGADIVLSKDFTTNKILRAYENSDYNLLESINVPFEKGIKWVLPNYAELKPHRKLELNYDEDYSFDYQYISMFFNSFPYSTLDFYISSFNFSGETVPLLKIFIADNFVGCISPIKKAK